MAEVTAMRNNALPYPVYGLPFTVSFPLLDADGDPISPSSPDSQISKNGDTSADCTNEATEIATSTGTCYLTLTGTELTCDLATVQIASTGAKTTVLTLLPRKLVALTSGTSQGSNDTGDIILASGAPAVDDYFNGCIVVAVIDGTTEVRLINDYDGATKTCEVSPAFVTAAVDNNDTYTIYLPEGRQIVGADLRSALGVAAQDSDFTIASATSSTVTLPSTYADAATLPDDDRYVYNALRVVGGTGKGQVVLLTSGAAGARVYNVIAASMPVQLDNTSKCVVVGQWSANTTKVAGTDQTAGDLATMITAVDDYVDTEVAAIKAKTDNLPSDPADASDIAALLATITGYIDTEVAAILAAVDTEVAAIKAKTDNLPSDPADASDIASSLATIAAYIDTEVAAIKAKTDQLVFGVTNMLNVNVTAVNETAVDGSGTEGDPWGPA